MIERENESRVRIARRHLDWLSIEDVAERITSVAGVAVDELRRRGRASRRSALRTIFACASHRLYGFTIADVAGYLGCSHSPMSRAARSGGKIAGEKEFAQVLMALRP